MWAFKQDGYVVDFRPNSDYYCIPLKFERAWHQNAGIYSITTKSYATINAAEEELAEYYIKQYDFSEVVQMLNDIELTIKQNKSISKLKRVLESINLDGLTIQQSTEILDILGY
ncbi:MAG: hypothetical protein R3321_07255 [Nitrososphaeraceae archaeon]|nr:hypothetical protein [Nitrososphaeraceae archaeon]